MKNYYEILGLSTTATDHEIKFVFRRLAITYHPDKNPTPEAEAIFKEVNEAYEVLSDPDKRLYYDQLLTGAVVQKELPSWHRDPAYRKRRQAGYRPPPREPSPRIVMMESFLSYVRILSWIACIWCALLFTDYVLPSAVSKEKIVTNANDLKKALLHSKGDLLVTEAGHHYPISLHELKYFPYESELKIFYSPVFFLLIKIENADSSYQVNNLATIYRNFIFAPVLLLILSLVSLFFAKGIEFRFNLGVVTFLIVLLNFIFFFMSKV
jgi:hypothetical protein